jgi:hypothetical protein
MVTARPRTSGRLVRRAIILATLLGIAGGATWVLAVHDLQFELDGDVRNEPDPAGRVDWADLFDSSGAPRSSLPANFLGMFSQDFILGGNADQTTFTTGSKDTLNISDGWECVPANNVNDKTDLLNTYTAFYVDPNNQDEVLYFGLERASNDGDGNVAIWFLRDPSVSCIASGKGGCGGSVGFTGNHMDGDLLVVSAFTKGGTFSTIDVYRWMGDAGGFGLRLHAA